MANEALKRYVVERLLTLDPTLSDSPGSPMHRLVIDPLLDRLGTDPLGLNIEEFIINRLKDDPLTENLDTESAGSFIKDILVRPLTLLLEPLQREIEFLKTQQSFATPDQLNRDEVDALLSNLFSTRKFGDLARGDVRIYYAAPQPVSMDASILFYTAAGLQFIPQEPSSFIEGDFTKSGDLFYIDVPVQSVVAHIGANVAKDSIKFVDGLPNVAKVTNLYSFSGGDTEENNDEFIRRAENSLSERSLNTKRGISTTLFDQFSQLKSLEVVGYKDPDMQRDKLTGTVTLSSEEVVGHPLYTVANIVVKGSELSPHGGGPHITLTNWSGTAFFPFTYFLNFEFADYTKTKDFHDAIVNADFLKIFDNGDLYDKEELGRPRRIKALTVHDATGAKLADISDNTARQVHVDLKDFETKAYGTSSGITSPYSNRFAGGDAEYLKGGAPSQGTGNWRGAPLPYTNLLEVDPADLPPTYNVTDGRDFLVLIGRPGDAFSEKMTRVFPLKQIREGKYLEIRRSDSYMLDRSKLGLPLTYKFSRSTWMGDLTPKIYAFGAPGLGDPGDPANSGETMFDGSTTVPGGVHGGATLYGKNNGSPEADTYVQLKGPDTWESLGVEVGHFISLSAYEYGTDTSAFTGDPLLEKFDWWGWGRVAEIKSHGDDLALRVTGVNHASLVTEPLHGYAVGKDPFNDGDYFGFSEAAGTDKFVLNWTVYKGETEVLLSNDNLSLSYDDFAYLPAYDTAGANSGSLTPPITYIPSPLGMEIATDASTTSALEMYRIGTNITGTVTGSDDTFAPVPDKQVEWVIIRTEKLFEADLLDNSGVVVGQTPEAEEITIDPALTTKYDDEGNGAVYLGARRPMGLRGYDWTDVGAAVPTFTAPGTTNKRGTRGYSIPAYMDTTAVQGMVFQFLSSIAAEASGTDPILTVSDIPGSYPFLDKFGPPLTVENDKVHIGGMTDVYLKGPAPTEEVISFSASPKDLTVLETLVINPDADIIFHSTEGVIYNDAANPHKHKLLEDLTLTTKFPTDVDAEALSSMVIEVLSSSYQSIVGNSYRIMGQDIIGSNDLRFDSVINDSGVDITLEYRILNRTTTSLVKPKVVLQQGSSLFIPLEKGAVFNSEPFNATSAQIGSLFLEILSGDSKGEYAVTEVNGTKLSVDGVLQGIEENVSFALYTYTTGIERPLVRVTDVSISSTTDAGIKIPYAQPVDALAESFSGLNNDPTTKTDFVLRPKGDYTAGANWKSNEATATLYSADTSFSFTVDAESIKYDVVHLIDVSSGDDAFFYITGFADNGTVAILDRDVTATTAVQTSLTGSVGKPSLGDVRMFFQHPTYAAATAANTVLTTSDGSLSFRPSPAERASAFKSDDFFTEVVITPNGGQTGADFDSTNTLDFEKLGIKIGDYVLVSKTVLGSTSAITAAEASDMTGLIGKTIVFSVDGIQRSVQFVNNSGLTLDDIVGQINASLGAYLRAKKVASGADFLLKLYCVNSLEIKDSSSGVISTLKLPTPGTAAAKNAYGSATLSVDSISMDLATGVSKLTASEVAGEESDVTTYTGEVFIEVVRPGAQIAFPNHMIKDTNGLYYFDITATSRAPLTTERLSENTQLKTSGLETLGFTLVTDNNNYTYSGAEETDIQCSALVLPEYAGSWEDSFEVSGRTIDITYERSQLVEDIQAFLLSDFDRVVCNNPLSRHYFPAYLYLALGTRGGTSLTEQKTAIVSYLSSLFPNKTLEAFDLEMVLARLGVDFVDHPVNMSFLVHDKDRKRTMFRSESALTLSKQFHIMEDDTNISVNRA